MTKVVSYRELEIYKMAHELAVEIHIMTVKELPGFEMYEEGSQIRRATKSIATNIAEGFGRRRYKAEFLRFLVFSHASSDEVTTHLSLLKETGSLKKERAEYFLNQYSELGP